MPEVRIPFCLATSELIGLKSLNMSLQFFLLWFFFVRFLLGFETQSSVKADHYRISTICSVKNIIHYSLCACSTSWFKVNCLFMPRQSKSLTWGSEWDEEEYFFLISLPPRPWLHDQTIGFRHGDVRLLRHQHWNCPKMSQYSIQSVKLQFVICHCLGRLVMLQLFWVCFTL